MAVAGGAVVALVAALLLLSKERCRQRAFSDIP